jgi:hypothetical protein
MNKTIENIIKKIAIRDIEIALKEAKIEGLIIPDDVFEIIKEVEDTYNEVKDNYVPEGAEADYEDFSGASEDDGSGR